MGKGPVSAFLLFTLACSLTGNPVAKNKNNNRPSPADFDYYLLTLSWAPEFCATNSKGKSSSECDPKKHYGFVVHGLWPQNNTGAYPHDCGPAQPVSQAIVQKMMAIMPDSGLIQHEWAKHGTCSGLSAQDYFESLRRAFGNVKVPEEYRAPAATMTDSTANIERKFAEANGAPQGAFRVSCPNTGFAALEVCLTKDLQYQACAAGLKECSAPHVSIRPTP
jgi:ribonuclease T2